MLLSKAPGPKKLQSCRGRIPLFPAIVSLLALIQASIRNRANSSYRHRRSAALGGMSIAITVGVSSCKPHRGAARQNLYSFPQIGKATPVAFRNSFRVVQRQWEARE